MRPADEGVKQLEEGTEKGDKAAYNGFEEARRQLAEKPVGRVGQLAGGRVFQPGAVKGDNTQNIEG